MQEAYAGIDVAFAKKKRLPVVVCTVRDARLEPLPLRSLSTKPPPGSGNAFILDDEAVNRFVDEAAEYLRTVERECNVSIQRVAIDAPSDPKITGATRRLCEVALDQRGIRCIATPSDSEFDAIRQKATSHLASGGAESWIPGANQLWMLVGFELFKRLRTKGRECLEVFPQAIVAILGANRVPKSRQEGLLAQLSAVARYTGWPTAGVADLARIAYGACHHRLDAYMSAWVASLDAPDREALGLPPNDVIWLPRLLSLKPSADKGLRKLPPSVGPGWVVGKDPNSDHIDSKPQMSGNTTARQLLILCTTTGYQTQAFVEAARKIGLSVVLGTDRCRVLQDPWQDGALPLRFEDPEKSAEQIVDFSRRTAIDAVVALGDRPTATAARACQALGLPYHPPKAVDACRDKHRLRERLRARGLHVPPFTRHALTADPHQLLGSGAPKVGFPCVLKPLSLSGSRGVVRADNAEQFVAAFERIRDLLRSPEVQVLREDATQFIQVEAYVEGPEVAVEAVVDRGQLKVLAIFDKPDPLEGPYFEETIYVTPSCLPPQVQAAVRDTLAQAVRVLGLFHGPVHAEFRLNCRGERRSPQAILAGGDTGGTPVPPGSPDVWVLETAARCIGGLCSRALRFCWPTLGESISLEELLIHLALGKNVDNVRREAAASGVMMIPIPQGGVYQGVEGVEEALGTPGVEDIVITAKPAQRLVSLPEGSSYLGFIFARGVAPQFVEEALRRAHEKLHFLITPALRVI